MGWQLVEPNRLSQGLAVLPDQQKAEISEACVDPRKALTSGLS